MNYTSEQFTEARKFCQLYFGTEEGVRLRAVPEGASCPEGIVKILDGSFEDKFIEAWALSSKGYAIYYMPQKYTDGEWQEKYEHITKFCGVVVDLDGTDVKAAVEKVVKDLGCPEPTVIVESSEGHYQVCWRFKEWVPVGELGIDQFNDLAFKLAAAMDGDFNAARATQPFRLPGFLNQKPGRAEWVARIAWINEKEDCAGGVAASTLLEWAAMPQTKEASSSGAIAKRGYENGEQDLDLAAVRLGEVQVGEGDRHRVVIRMATMLLDEGMTEEECLAELHAIAVKSFVNGAEFLEKRHEEIVKAVRDAAGYVEVNRERDKAARELAEKEKDEIGEQLAVITPFKGVVAPFVFDFGRGSLAINKYTETAIAERVIQRFGVEFCRVGDRDLAFNHTEKVWKEQKGVGVETQHKVLEIVKDAVGEPDFVRACSDSRGRPSITALRAAQQKMFSGRFLAMCGQVVKNHSWVRSKSWGDFDAREALLYCANGVLDMSAPERGVRDACGEDYLLKRSEIAWVPDAECKEWEKFVGEIYGGDTEMAGFMQEVFGYSLSGWINEERIFCHLGDGCNGKSKLLSGLRQIAGGYVKILSSDELVSKKSGSFGQAFERLGAKVEGSRVGVVDDLDVGSTWNEGFVKMLTGKVILTRSLYKEACMVPNRTKFHLGLNSAPEVEAENNGIVRRLCIIPYEIQFENDSQKSLEIDRIVEQESQGILAWAVRGFGRWYGRGKSLNYPRKTVDASVQYTEDKFPVQSLIKAMYERGEDWVPGRVIKDELDAIAARRGQGLRVSIDSVGRALKNLGVSSAKRRTEYSNSERGYFVKRVGLDLAKSAFSLL